MKPFDEKTGNPVADNENRRANRRMRDKVKSLSIETPDGRKRKKHVRKVEGAHYAELVVAVVEDLKAGRANFDR